MRNPVKVAILGFGFMGKKHFSAINNLPGAEITAIIDTETPSDSLEGVSHFTMVEKFFQAKTDTEIVVIATPNFAHFPQAKILLENGYDILLEKPFAQRTNELEEIFNIAEKENRKVFFSTSNRFSAVSFWLKELLDSQKLGEILMLQINCFWNRNENYYTPNSWKGKKDLDGGTLYTQFFHFLDLIFWLFGAPEIKFSSVKTLRYNDLIEIEDCGTLTFEFKNGALGNMNFSTAVFDKNLESTMTILGETGTVKIGGQYFDKVEFCNVKGFEFEGFNENNFSNLEQNWQEILEIYRGEKTYFLDKNHHLEVLKFIEKAYNFYEK